MSKITASSLTNSLRRFLMTPTTTGMAFCFGLSMAFAAFCAWQGIREGLTSNFIVQDDVRQVVFWMHRFVDPGLFPNDLIADYYQAVSPPGFSALFRLMAWLGVDLILLTKILPIILGLITTAYCFALVTRLLPAPVAGFISALLLNQFLWIGNDVASATPRAFLYPFFFAFLYYLLKRSWLPCMATIALQGLFYPPIAFITSGVLASQLIVWEGGRPRLSRERKNYLFIAIGLAVALAAVVPFAMRSSRFGSVVTASEAALMPGALAEIRLGFLNDGFWSYWFTSNQSGFLWLTVVPPFGIFAGLFLPLLMKGRRFFPLAGRISAEVWILIRVALVSLLMFFAAHLVLFKLYLPNRYSQPPLIILTPIAAGLALTVLIDALLQWAGSPKRLRQSAAIAAIAIVWSALLLYPLFPDRFPRTHWTEGGDPALYEFFSAQPKDVLIASLSPEANNLPTFAGRSVLVARHYANPYHAGFYLELNQRYNDLFDAQYTDDLNEVQSFIRKYGIDYFMLDRDAFTPEYFARRRLLRRIDPSSKEIRKKLEGGFSPALARVMRQCVVFETENSIVLSAACIAGLD